MKSVLIISAAAALAACDVLAQGVDPTQALGGLPGFDFSRLSPPAKRVLLQVLTDEFDACGRPLTLLASLKKGDPCKHTRRMVGLAAGMAQEGTGADEIIVAISRHNQSFKKVRPSFRVDERSCMGPKDARVTMVEFSDFECPFCATARKVLEAFVARQSAARLCWSPFPLPMHANGVLASQAVMFAREHGKFWALHDTFFDNQLSLSPEYIRATLKASGLDVAAFDRAVAQNRYVDEINASKEAGRTAGVEGTPTLFVNGRKHMLALSQEGLALSIEEELDWLAGNNGWPSN